MTDELVQRVKLVGIQTMLANEGKDPDGVFDAIARAIIPLVAADAVARERERAAVKVESLTQYRGRRAIAAAIRAGEQP